MNNVRTIDNIVSLIRQHDDNGWWFHECWNTIGLLQGILNKGISGLTLIAKDTSFPDTADGAKVTLTNVGTNQSVVTERITTAILN